MPIAGGVQAVNLESALATADYGISSWVWLLVDGRPFR
jgi:hypothetical protein